jgi:hypothetical protein
MEIIKKWLGNVWNIVPAIIGIIEIVVPLLKELLVTLARLIGVLPFLWDAPQPIIDKINAAYDKILAWVENVKNTLLITK